MMYQQLCIHIAVHHARRTGRHCARQRQQRCPEALGNQRDSRNMTCVERADAAKEEPVARHRIVDARARQNQAVVALNVEIMMAAAIPTPRRSPQSPAIIAVPTRFCGGVLDV